MLGLLRLPPPLLIAILLAIAGYTVYRIVEAGKIQPLPIIILVVLAFALVRVVWRMVRKPQVSEDAE